MSYFSGDDGHDYYRAGWAGNSGKGGDLGRTKARSLARRRGWENCKFIGDGGSRRAGLVPPPGNGDCC